MVAYELLSNISRTYKVGGKSCQPPSRFFRNKKLTGLICHVRNVDVPTICADYLSVMFDVAMAPVSISFFDFLI